MKHPLMSYNRLLYHIVFRTKHSLPAITEVHEKRLYSYIWGYVRNNDCVLHRIGGMPDHIHLLEQLPTTLAVSDFMRVLKTSTNKWLVERHDEFPLFDGWGKSYCAITCSYSERNRIVEYISNQKMHHRRFNFMEELQAIFQKNSIADSVDNFPRRTIV